MPNPTVDQLFVPDSVIDKLWAHGLVPEQVQAVLTGYTVIVRNLAGRAAPYVLLGRDEHGQCLAIPIAPTHDRLIWRVVTAWRCKPSEVAKLGHRRSIMEEPSRFGVTQEPLDDEERELMNPETWDWETAVEADIAENPLLSFPIALSLEEHRLLARVAHAERLTTPAFIKRAALSVATARAADAEDEREPRAASA